MSTTQTPHTLYVASRINELAHFFPRMTLAEVTKVVQEEWDEYMSPLARKWWACNLPPSEEDAPKPVDWAKLLAEQTAEMARALSAVRSS
jgi:hypothetical protein